MTKKKTLHRGDSVEWKSTQGKVDGTVEKKVESETHIKGHKVKASEEDPQYVVKSNNTGAKAAHKPEALKKQQKKS